MFDLDFGAVRALRLVDVYRSTYNGMIHLRPDSQVKARIVDRLGCASHHNVGQFQWKAAVDERDLLARRLIELQNTLEQTQREAITGRKLIEEQFRASENRWLQEVDRARTDASQAIASLAQVEKQHATALQAMEDRASALQAELAERERIQIRMDATADAQRIEIERLYNQLEPAAKGS